MKKIVHHFGVEPDWVESFASQQEGLVKDNFIIVPDHINTGTRYFLNCDFGISVLYYDVCTHLETHLRQENKTDDFLGIYYNLTEGESVTVLDGTESPTGKLYYNLIFMDSALNWDYIFKSESKTFALCIFIKKDLIKEYFQNNPSLKDRADDILNPKLNTIVKFTRMSNTSYHLLMDLRSKEVGGTAFDFHLQGTVQSLLADYIEKMADEEIIIDKVNDTDLKDIIQSQAYLIENINKAFPSIESLAQQANMSPSKYKTLFKKITGLTPNTFFLNNKLLEAKQLLTERQLTILEISHNLSFTSNSYFATKFKQFFGILPRDFIKQLQ